MVSLRVAAAGEDLPVPPLPSLAPKQAIQLWPDANPGRSGYGKTTAGGSRKMRKINA